MKFGAAFVAKRICISAVLCMVLTLPCGAGTAGWPPDIYGGSAFSDIGKAIKNEAGFPTLGSDIEKARYVFSRLPDIQSKYDLKAGTGTVTSNALIGTARLTDSLDPEQVNSLKSVNRGNCSEWSMAFQAVLGGAGVQSTVMYGDADPNPGFSKSFTGTDTALFVEQVGPDGTIVRRVFDPFQALYCAQTNGQPVDSQLKTWGDNPLSNADRLPTDDPKGDTWMTAIGKPYVKSQATEQLLPANTKARTSKVSVQTAGSRFIGKWQDKGAIMFIYDEGNTFTARAIKPGRKLISYGVKDGAYSFTSGVVKAGPPLTIQTKKAYCYAAKSDCPTLAPFTGGVATLSLDIGMDRIHMSIKSPQYDSKECRWALDAPWMSEDSDWTRMSDEATSK